MRGSEVHLFDDHDTAYDIWKKAGVRGRTLVHLDGHVDFEWIADRAVGEVLRAGSPQEVDRLLAAVSAWDLDDRPPRDRITIANFVYPAITEGLIGRFIWVMPDAFWTSRRHRRVVVNGLERKLRRRPGAAGPLQVSDAGITFSVLGCPVLACTRSQLPRLQEPVLLDIDIDYLVTTAPDGPAPYFAARAGRPWIWPRELFAWLQAARLDVEIATIARSVNGGFTPLRYRYFGDLLAAACRTASAPAADAPAPGSAAEAYASASRSFARRDLPAARRSWQDTIRRDPSYRTAYAFAGWREETAGRWRAAWDLYERMREVDPSWHLPHLGAGRVLWRLRRFAAAERAFEAARARSDDGPAAYWMGVCRFRRDDLRGAARIWAGAHRARPDDASIEYALACAAAGRGDGTAAIRHAQRSRTLGHQNRALHDLFQRVLRRRHPADVRAREWRRWARRIVDEAGGVRAA